MKHTPLLPLQECGMGDKIEYGVNTKQRCSPLLCMLGVSNIGNESCEFCGSCITVTMFASANTPPFGDVQ